MNNYFWFDRQPLLAITFLKKLTIVVCVCLVATLNFYASESVAQGKKFKSKQKITVELLEQLEATIQGAMATYSVPGTAIAIVERGEIVYAKGFGWRDLENQQPVTPHTRFLLGSVTKSMTATMIATLVDDGFLDWKQPVVEIWPDFTLPTDELTQQVQVRHLMQMATGLAEPVGLQNLYDIKVGNVSAEEQLQTLATLPVVADLGEIFYPNNNVFASASFIAALAYGTEYGDLYNGYKQLMQERLFDPIGMESTQILDLPPIDSDYAKGYAFNLITNRFEPLSYPNLPNIEGFAPDGFVFSNVMDISRYLMTQLKKGIAPDGNRVVSVQNLKKIQQPQTDATNDLILSVAYPLAESIHYGTGWIIAEQPNGVKVIGHPGGMEGFVADMAFIPDTHIGIVTLTNLNYYHGFLSGPHFIGVVRDRLFELLYDLEPTVVQTQAQQYQQVMGQLAIPPELIQVNFTPETVAPFLGDYQKGWRLELRDAGSLWLVLQDSFEYQLVLLPNGFFMISNNGILGTTIILTMSETGMILMTIVPVGAMSANETDTVIKIN